MLCRFSGTVREDGGDRQSLALRSPIRLFTPSGSLAERALPRRSGTRRGPLDGSRLRRPERWGPLKGWSARREPLSARRTGAKPTWRCAGPECGGAENCCVRQAALAASLETHRREETRRVSGRAPTSTAADEGAEVRLRHAHPVLSAPLQVQLWTRRLEAWRPALWTCALSFACSGRPSQPRTLPLTGRPWK